MFVNEDVYIEAKFLELQVKVAVLTEGPFAELESFDSKYTRLKVIIEASEIIKRACEKELELWKQVEKCERWFEK